MDWEKIFANDVTKKGMISKIYKQLIQLRASWWLSGKELACQCSRCKFDPWIRKTLGEGNGNQFQYSCLRNFMDGEVWQFTVHRVATTQIQLSN